jgi:hypothetical protein
MHLSFSATRGGSASWQFTPNEMSSLPNRNERAMIQKNPSEQGGGGLTRCVAAVRGLASVLDRTV